MAPTVVLFISPLGFIFSLLASNVIVVHSRTKQQKELAQQLVTSRNEPLSKLESLSMLTTECVHRIKKYSRKCLRRRFAFSSSVCLFCLANEDIIFRILCFHSESLAFLLCFLQFYFRINEMSYVKWLILEWGQRQKLNRIDQLCNRCNRTIPIRSLGIVFKSVD